MKWDVGNRSNGRHLQEKRIKNSFLSLKCWKKFFLQFDTLEAERGAHLLLLEKHFHEKSMSSADTFNDLCQFDVVQIALINSSI